MDNNDLIVINKQELNTEYVNNRIREERESKKDLNKAERIPVHTNIFLNPIFYTGVCGLIAALIGWGVLEPFVKDIPKKTDIALSSMVVLITMLSGATISSIDSLVSRNFLKALKTGCIGLGLGLITGIFCSRIISNYIYNLLLIIIGKILLALFPELENTNSEIVTTIYYMTSRAPAWAVLGAGIGILPGIANWSKKLFFNGLIGGMIGGFIGGILFDPIVLLTKNIFTGAGLSRGIGFAILGLMIGILVGLVENMAKDVWVTMKSGPLRGKQFVIYHNPTLIGSSPRSDIYIFKDPNVMPTHAKIQRIGSKYEIIDNSNGIGVYINSEKINGSKILENNDEIILGQSVLEFQQKERL